MQYTAIMQSFERDKNLKATYLTAGIVGLLLLITLLISWNIPTAPPPVFEEGMEVNLGNSDFGSGTIQPLIPGPPAASQDEVNVPKTSQASSSDEKDILKDENDAEAPPIVKKEEKKPVIKPTPTVSNDKKVTKPNPVPNPTPAPPKPKATYKGGTSNTSGGNNADTYNNSRNQGISNGNGDQGKTNGDPNSDRYDGTGGKGNGNGPRILSGDRKIVRFYAFEGELPPAVISARIRVSPDGKGQFVEFAKGSSNTSSAYRDAIKSYLPNISFDKSDHESIVVVQFVFKTK